MRIFQVAFSFHNFFFLFFEGSEPKLDPRIKKLQMIFQKIQLEMQRKPSNFSNGIPAKTGQIGDFYLYL